MNIELYAAYLLATFILIVVPGPNVALIIASSIGHGVRHGLATVAGTASAQVIQLAVVVAGMTSFIALMADWFAVLKWVGAAYLIYLGIRRLIAAGGEMGFDREAAAEPRLRALYLRGFLVACTNPKVLFFYAAFFPQFVDPALPVLPQLFVLAGSFMAIALVCDSGYALLAGRARLALRRSRMTAWLDRVTGGILIGTGVWLALARRG